MWRSRHFSGNANPLSHRYEPKGSAVMLGLGAYRVHKSNEFVFRSAKRSEIRTRGVKYEHYRRPHSSLKYLTPAAYAANLTATDDRLRNPDQLRRSSVAPPAPLGVQHPETLTAAG
jgi:hypothetical protein